MDNSIQRRYLPRFKLLSQGLLAIACLLQSLSAWSQTTDCAPGSTVVQGVSSNILTGDAVQAPWTNETPVNLRSFETIDSWIAMRVDLSQWAPIAFDGNGEIQAGDFDVLEFMIRSSVDSPPINLIASSGVVCHLSQFLNLNKNVWERVQIPLTSLGLSGPTSIGRLKIKSTIADAYTVWIADVRLISDNITDTPAEEVATLAGECIQRPTTAAFIPWDEDPGVRENIEDHLPDTVVTLAANGQDQSDDSASFFAALEAISQGGIVEVPAGTYYLSSSIELSAGNQIIRGAGSDKTHLIFTESLPYGIAITGQYPKSPTNIVKGEYGSKRLLVDSLSEDVVGRYGVVTNAGSLHSQVISISGQTALAGSTELSLSQPLNSVFTVGANVQFFDANEFSGIESLSVDVNSATTHINDMIYLRSAAHVWLRNIQSRRARQAHVFTRQTYGCEITGSTFLDATGHGDGKQGYGIDLANSTTGCLVENNTLGYLRHSILLNASANGNVIAFNHSFSPRHTNFFEGGPGDISFHGFSYANLVEGNVVERIHIGDSGAVGEGNLVHRNCLTSGPLTVGNSPDAVQSLYTNAMYGTDTLLQATVMPPVLPETSQPRPYLQAGASLFDDDGVTVSASALEPSLKNNWYMNRQSNINLETPDSYYGSLFSPLLKVRPTNSWMSDCRIPALVKAQGL